MLRNELLEEGIAAKPPCQLCTLAELRSSILRLALFMFLKALKATLFCMLTLAGCRLEA